MRFFFPCLVVLPCDGIGIYFAAITLWHNACRSSITALSNRSRYSPPCLRSGSISGLPHSRSFVVHPHLTKSVSVFTEDRLRPYENEPVTGEMRVQVTFEANKVRSVPCCPCSFFLPHICRYPAFDIGFSCESINSDISSAGHFRIHQLHIIAFRPGVGGHVMSALFPHLASCIF
jgi:hypothetical protein